MWTKLKDLLNKAFTALILAMMAYFYGKKEAERERIEKENAKLKKGLNAAMRGDYSADAVRERMRENQHQD